nr:hypothetical protein [uncultured Flavobacterium sp.]
MFVDPLAEKTMEPYSYTGNNLIMFTDPTGMSKEGGENDYLFDKDNNLIAVAYNNNPDRYFRESEKSSTSVGFKSQDGSIKYGEEIKPSFSIVEVISEVEGGIGHSALGYDGNVFSYYPTKDDGSTSDFGTGHMWGTELQQVTSSQSDFKDKYPLANSFFVKVDSDQKNSLISDVTNRGTFLNKSDETYNLSSNNCTTNVSNHLIKSGILGSDSYKRRPGTFNSMLKSNNKVSSSILRESSIGRTAKKNVRESLNNVTVNGKRVKK